MKKSLYNIEEEYQQLMLDIERADGEVTTEQSEQLTINEGEREQKSVAYICVIKNSEAEIAKIDEEIKRLQAWKKREQSTIQRLKDNLVIAVHLFGEYSAGMFKVSQRKSTAVQIDDADAIHTDYITTKITNSIDKTAIKNAIKEGITVEGASIVTNFNLAIK